VLCILHAVKGCFVGGHVLLLVLLILATAVVARLLVEHCGMRQQLFVCGYMIL
jgi:hypothetical protein